MRVAAHYATGARHKLLNGAIRDEVQRDGLEWPAKTM
jgi:hypothetical protein